MTADFGKSAPFRRFRPGGGRGNIPITGPRFNAEIGTHKGCASSGAQRDVPGS